MKTRDKQWIKAMMGTEPDLRNNVARGRDDICRQLKQMGSLQKTGLMVAVKETEKVNPAVLELIAALEVQNNLLRQILAS